MNKVDPGSVTRVPHNESLWCMGYLTKLSMYEVFMKRFIVASLFAFAGTLGAQGSISDISAKLHSVLPAEQADRIVAKISEARSRQLPTAALEQQALMLAKRGKSGDQIEQAINSRENELAQASAALQSARGNRANDTEVEAAAEAIHRGVDGAKVSELAKSAPSGRSLAVPLFVIGSLVDRGLPSDSALARVRARLLSRASDSAINNEAKGLGDSISAARHARNDARKTAHDSTKAARHANKGNDDDTENGAKGGRPPLTGQALAATKRPTSAGKPEGVPGNSGSTPRPIPPGHGGTNPGKGKGRNG